MEIGRVEAGFRPLYIVILWFVEVEVGKREEYVSISLRKP